MMKLPLKLLNDGIQRAFWVGEYMEVLGKTMDTLLFFPPYFALCVSSIWLFLSWIFYNELVIVNWRRKWQPTPLFLPGKPHGQRSLAGYSLWGHKRVRHDLATKTTKQETAMVSKVFPWVLCAVPANHKPEERTVETPNFQPVSQKYLGLGLVSEVEAVLWNWILYLVGSEANSRYIVLELNCWTPMWRLKSWQIGLVWGNIHTFSIRSVLSKNCSEAAVTKYHRLGGKEPACQGRRHETGSHPGSGRSLEEGTITHSSILTRRIPRIEECGRL